MSQQAFVRTQAVKHGHHVKHSETTLFTGAVTFVSCEHQEIVMPELAFSGSSSEHGEMLDVCWIDVHHQGSMSTARFSNSIVTITLCEDTDQFIEGQQSGRPH